MDLSALDLNPDGVIVADHEGRVVFVNAWVRHWAHAEGDEMIGMKLSDAMPFDDLAGNSWVDTVRPYDGLSIRRRISEQSWWSARGSEYLVTALLQRSRPAGRVDHVIISIRNARARNQADRDRSDMVATVAHELRSPLTGIKGFSATLIKRWDQFSDEQRKFMLATIDSDADRLSRLVTELLDAARIDAGRLTLRTEAIDVPEMLQRVLGSVFSQADEVPEVHVEDDPEIIWGDADRLIQVFTNLIENAVRHGTGLRSVVVSGIGTGVEVAVSDRGPGIPPDSRQRVYSRFWKTGPGAGSGLGMFIVRGIVDQHDGTITIDDHPEGGAAITVCLPTNRPETMGD